MNTDHTLSLQSPNGSSSSSSASTTTVESSDTKPHRAWLAASMATATAALQACGGGGEDSPTSSSLLSGTTPTMSAQATVSGAGLAAVQSATVGGGTTGPLGVSRIFVNPANDSDASRFLQQAQFSASAADIAAVRSLGYAGWLATQFNLAPGTTAWDWLIQRGYGQLDSNNFHFTSYQSDFAVWWQLIKSQDTVRKRVALALSEIFSVSSNGVGYYWNSQLMASWWDTLSNNALGNFRKLLEDVTLHPAMGLYLNCRGSQKENAAGRQPDENFAREIMQLMTIGLVKLNPDGTPVLSGGVPLDSYTQDDVMNLARVFTGYDFDMSGLTTTAFSGQAVPNIAYARRPMTLNASLHSTLSATFLGTTVKAGTEGNAARKIALDALFQHSNVGPFIGKQLIQRLVTSNPSPGYVRRVAAAFNNNGQGVRGDIAAVVAAILLDDEARTTLNLPSPTYGRLREPVVRLVQWARTFGLDSTSGSWKLYDQSPSTSLGQSPLRSPSIFNFFRPGYAPPASAVSAAGLVAPEFQLVNESSVSIWVNYLQNVARNGFYVGAPNLPQLGSNGSDGFDLAASYTEDLAIAHNSTALVSRLNLVLTANQLSTQTVSLITSVLDATPITVDSTKALKLNRIAACVLMVMSSYEYLVQK